MSPSDDAPTSRHLLLPLEAPRYEYWRPGWTEAPHVSAQAVDALRYAGRRSASISVPDGYLLPDSDTAPQGPKGLSGSDGTRGAALTVDTDATRHTGDGSDSDSEDGSAGAQGSGSRRTHAWRKGDTPHVAALLGKEREVDRPAPAAPSVARDPYFDMVADVRAETRNSVGKHLYTVKTTLDRRRHYHHVSQSYHLSIDTGEPDTWLYAYGFQKIIEDGEGTYAWSRVEAENGHIHMNRFVVPIPSDGLSWELPGPFPTEHAPSPPLEWTTRHADGGLAYLRYVPHGILQTELPRWHWKDRQQSSTPLRIPCVLAYAANRRLAMQVRAGHIGLAVPSAGNFTGDPSVSKPSFFDALESSPDLQLDEEAESSIQPRKFLIKLNHPDVEEECLRGKAPSLVYFGSAFPCILQPQFTPKLFVYGRVDVDVSSPLKYEHWRLGLSSISLVDADAPDDILTIDLANRAVEPSNDGDTDPSADKTARDYVQVILDTGSTHSVLPRRAVQTISTIWLRNKEELKDGGTVHAYCGPERDLDKCDIVFTFRGLDGAPVKFQCAAKPFLQSPWALKTASDAAGETPRHYYSNIRAHVPGEPEEEESCDVPFVFGTSFYWAAFVEHCGPVRAKDTSEIHEPYVCLAAQRATMPDGSIGYAKDFHVPPDPPPKSSEQPAKHEWPASTT
ncbi:uncharacterized protein TRAVEDRAFT_52616 [Trametes versicolor FP-101664 SS1]|uniref:uncharacterized protein n=1 Tax=Trametes versicolor (strain FP-101664) TaxID=717944 RepID=UPI0004621232|nr:uncharacterized protein TRAVEDRAFT_52616 [Trametes versicolor FP-101664 SS1]EIW53486.1 hypothetical protein TRAVEDRAFT_52616 [Trametes versicolor FP-101664 SS1]